MSQFTAGTLFLNRDREAILTALAETSLPHMVKELNQAWSVFLTPDEWHFLPDTQAAVRHISETAPLLHFSNAEDHGWSFRLLHGGRERAAFSEHHPWDPLRDLLVGEDEPHSLPTPPSAEELIYFRLLDLPPETVDHLAALLAGAPDCIDQSPGGRVEAFKRLLGIADMEWISYRYLSREGAAG